LLDSPLRDNSISDAPMKKGVAAIISWGFLRPISSDVFHGF
jgi:hypothetical protein